MNAQFIIVVESNLSEQRSGAEITTSEAVSESAGLELLERVVRGEVPEIYRLYKKGTMLRVNERQYLDVSTETWALRVRQTRLSLVEVVSTRG